MQFVHPKKVYKEPSTKITRLIDKILHRQLTSLPHCYYTHTNNMAPEEPQGPPEQQPIDTFDVTEPFLPTRNPPSPSPLSSSTPKQVRIRLYISHGLSTWNSRMFEFGAVLFLNSIFKGTLLYASVYALVRSLAAVVLASWLGSVADRMGRLRAVRQSIGIPIQCIVFESSMLIHNIVWQRIPVAASCVCFGLLSEMRTSSSTIGSLDYALFTGVVLLACVEKLAATANMAAVEMDWVRVSLPTCSGLLAGVNYLVGYCYIG